MSGFTAVRGLISGIAGGRCATASPGAGGCAPASIHLRTISISPSASFFPPRGMAGATAPAIRKYRRLTRLLPGTITGPLWPPFWRPAKVSRFRAAMVTLPAWHPAQFAAKMGATSLVKEGASSAHIGIAKQSRTPPARGTIPLIPAFSKLLPFSLHPIQDCQAHARAGAGEIHAPLQAVRVDRGRHIAPIVPYRTLAVRLHRGASWRSQNPAESRLRAGLPAPQTPYSLVSQRGYAFYRLPTDSSGGALGERRVRISRMGGWPKKRLYSRLNWLALSYPTS